MAHHIVAAMLHATRRKSEKRRWQGEGGLSAQQRENEGGDTHGHSKAWQPLTNNTTEGIMRSPRQHAADTADIMNAPTMPKHDSKIMPAPKHVENPRHRDLADELRPLLIWRRLLNPNSANWLGAANDNVSLTHADNQPGVEAELEQRPTVGELKRAWEEDGPEAAMKLRTKDQFGTPKGPDDRDRADRDTKARAQKRRAIAALKFVLEFIEGEPIEPAQSHDPEFTPCIWESFEGAAKLAARDLLREHGVGRETPFEEARTRALRNTVANDNRPGFPWLPKDPRAIFFAGKVRPHGTRNEWGEFNDGVSYAEAERHEFAHLRGKMSKDAVTALDIAIEAQDFAEVGEAFGFTGPAAKKQGQRIVQEACAELRGALASAD
jgi:hypothetical protein